jgi:hypothetical protein
VGLFAGDTGQARTTDSATNANLSSAAVWRSANPIVATVSADGVVNALSAGTTVLSATYNGAVASGTLTVLSDADLLSLALIDCGNRWLLGQTLNCRAQMTTTGPAAGTYIPDSVVWTSTNPAVIGIGTGGHGRALSVGQATYSATYHGKTVSMTASVVAAQQDALLISGAGWGANDFVVSTGSSLILDMSGVYSVVSAPTGELLFQITDNFGNVVAATAPRLAQQSDSFSFTLTIIVPQVTQLCWRTILRIGSTDIRANNDTSCKPIPFGSTTTRP